MWVCLLGILMLQSLTKIHNWAKKCSLKGKQTNRALCQCARKKKDLFWWTAAWEMCTVWFVLQGSLLVNYKTMVVFCCTALPSSSTKFFVWVCFQFQKPKLWSWHLPFHHHHTLCHMKNTTEVISDFVFPCHYRIPFVPPKSCEHHNIHRITHLSLVALMRENNNILTSSACKYLQCGQYASWCRTNTVCCSIFSVLAWRQPD